jgi:hypothetical protein
MIEGGIDEGMDGKIDGGIDERRGRLRPKEIWNMTEINSGKFCRNSVNFRKFRKFSYSEFP